jgi:hypothetical protein
MVRAHGVPDLATNVMTVTFTGIFADCSPAGGTNTNWRRRVASVGLFSASAALGRPRTGTIARQAKTRGLPRLPLRVERPKDVFNPRVLNVRLVQGAASYLTSYQQTVCLRRHPIDLKKRNATPSDLGVVVRHLLLRRLS